jgi:hypothetical protein
MKKKGTNIILPVLFNGSVILYIVNELASLPCVHECPPVQLFPGAIIKFLAPLFLIPLIAA